MYGFYFLMSFCSTKNNPIWQISGILPLPLMTDLNTYIKIGGHKEITSSFKCHLARMSQAASPNFPTISLKTKKKTRTQNNKHQKLWPNQRLIQILGSIVLNYKARNIGLIQTHPNYASCNRRQWEANCPYFLRDTEIHSLYQPEH